MKRGHEKGAQFDFSALEARVGVDLLYEADQFANKKALSKGDGLVLAGRDLELGGGEFAPLVMEVVAPSVAARSLQQRFALEETIQIQIPHGVRVEEGAGVDDGGRTGGRLGQKQAQPRVTRAEVGVVAAGKFGWDDRHSNLPPW